MKMKNKAIDQHNVLMALNYVQEEFEASFGAVQECVHKTAVDRGQWEEVISVNDVISHIHAEVSEMYTEIMKGNDDAALTECADIVLMCMSLAEEKKWDLAEAIITKAKYNVTRDDEKPAIR